MKRVADILRGDLVWVNPNHPVRSAAILMHGHGVKGLPVLDGSHLVGIVRPADVLWSKESALVHEVMDSEPHAIASSLSVRDAAEIMTRFRTDTLPVLDANGALCGVLSSADILSELLRFVDPLTELPGQDSMREWAISQLQLGREITLLVVDINDFKMFNTYYGLVIGDTVLRSVADIIKELIDPEREVVCRYGGDEFCIATLRLAEEAGELAERIERDCSYIRLPEPNEARITVTVGLYGGRRTHEREYIHYNATLNDLINLATRDCMTKKARRQNALGEGDGAGDVALSNLPNQAVVRQGAGLNGRAEGLRLLNLEVSQGNSDCSVMVELAGGIRASTTSPLLAATPEAKADEAAHLVMQTTCAALRKLLPSGYELNIDEIQFGQTGDNRGYVTVVGTLKLPSELRPLLGSAFLSGDPFRAIASATLSAANRQISRILGAMPMADAPQRAETAG